MQLGAGDPASLHPPHLSFPSFKSFPMSKQQSVVSPVSEFLDEWVNGINNECR
jgi:hypothetical protein